MNAMLRIPRARRPARSTGQSIYEVMLIISCAAMALAVIFAAYEYFAYYHGQPSPSATAPLARPAAPAPSPKMPPAPPAAAPAPATGTSATQGADPRENPDTAIAEAVRLLEAKDYKTFLQNFTPPDALEFLLSIPNTTIDSLANDVATQAPADMVQCLKSIKDVKKPEISSDGMKATYKLEKPLSGKDTLTLVKIGKLWYFGQK